MSANTVINTTMTIVSESKKRSSFRTKNSEWRNKGKKQVRFTDIVYPESTSFWRRFVTLVRTFWINTTVTVKTVFSK